MRSRLVIVFRNFLLLDLYGDCSRTTVWSDLYGGARGLNRDFTGKPESSFVSIVFFLRHGRPNLFQRVGIPRLECGEESVNYSANGFFVVGRDFRGSRSRRRWWRDWLVQLRELVLYLAQVLSRAVCVRWVVLDDGLELVARSHQSGLILRPCR